MPGKKVPQRADQQSQQPGQQGLGLNLPEVGTKIPETPEFPQTPSTPEGPETPEVDEEVEVAQEPGDMKKPDLGQEKDSTGKNFFVPSQVQALGGSGCSLQTVITAPGSLWNLLVGLVAISPLLVNLVKRK